MTDIIIDEATINELRLAVGEDFLPVLISTYLEDTPNLIHELEMAFQEGKAEAFGRAAHSIKSSSASLGALAFSIKARELEMIGKSGDLSNAQEKLEGLKTAYPVLERALKQLV